MARPRTELGGWGRITVVGQVHRDGRWVSAQGDERPTQWRARTKVRDVDGVLRDVQRVDRSKARAERLLLTSLRDRVVKHKGDDLNVDMTVSEAGKVWLQQVRRPDHRGASGRRISPATVEQYTSSFHRYIASGSIAGLTLREVNRVPAVRRFLQEVADRHGTGAAKTARSVLSGIIHYAVCDGVLELNAVKSVAPAEGAPRDTPRDIQRALTEEERNGLLSLAPKHRPSQDTDVVDLIRFLAGTGVRISEALDQQWEDVDLERGSVHVRGTKSKHADRVLTMPRWLVDFMRQRHSRGVPSSGLVFAAPRTGERRDRRNAARALRRLFDDAGLPWATPHSLRRTVATRMDAAGMPLALAADQLGHANPAMTASAYLGRRGDLSRAAEAL